MTTNKAWPMRVERILAPHGLAMPEYYLLATAGYRVNLERRQFIGHAAGEFQGDGWPVFTADRMESALDRLLEARLMLILTEADLQTERARRAASENRSWTMASTTRPVTSTSPRPGISCSET